MINSRNMLKLNVTLKLSKNGRVVYSRSDVNPNRFNHLIGAYGWDSAYLKVNYKPGVHNDGKYTDPETLKTNFSEWIQQDLIDYAHSHQF